MNERRDTLASLHHGTAIRRLNQKKSLNAAMTVMMMIAVR